MTSDNGNECKPIFLCKDSGIKPCTFKSGEINCEFLVIYNNERSCVSPKARIAAMINKLQMMTGRSVSVK